MLSHGAQRLAAKFGDEPGRPSERFHPLACHLADVAAVAGALWDLCLPEGVRRQLSEGLGFGEDTARASRWAALLAGVHDLGKASRPFQARDEHHAARLDGTGLDAACACRDRGHGRVTAAQLGPLLVELGIQKSASVRLAALVGGHHGLFHEIGAGGGRGIDICEHGDIEAAWQVVRQELVEALARVLDVGEPPAMMPLPNSAAMLLAGFVTIADWIGSMEKFFEWAPAGAGDLREYHRNSCLKARMALGALNWLAYREPDGASSFSALFGFPPRPLQAATANLHSQVAEGGLAIIEAPMGEGKTEAALHLVDSWNADGAGRGFYVALPTQATANQMYTRTAAFLKKRHAEAITEGESVNLVLAHGAAARTDRLVLPSGIFGGEEGEAGEHGRREGTVGAGEWFLPRKRSLLAPYGVGTIDQALMAVLQVKHVFVRLFGLAGKPVVIDEVHAYDTYMTGLLDRLLEWLGAMGSPVVMLSATLPSARRTALIAAYRRGSEGETEPKGTFEPVAYPRVTWASGSAAGTVGFEADRRSRRRLQLSHAPDDTGELAGFVRDLVAGGGCAAVICNTVARAQVAYTALREAGLGPGRELALFHARFLERDRRRIERRCLRLFGKPDEGSLRTRRRRRRFVLVATQVVEQSLDLDFDFMVTDFAPVDLLLQRSGRLQRHDRDDRPRALEPVLHIRWPEEPGSLPQFDPGTRAVYEEHVLLRTWHALRGRDAIGVPGDVQELVDAVYAEGEALPSGADEALAGRWGATWKEMLDKRQLERQEAEARRLRRPGGEPVLPTAFLRDPRAEDDADLHPALQALTRLADPSVSVVLLRAGSPLVPVSGERLDWKMVEHLLGHSVAVSSRLAVAVLAKLEPPPAFAATAALRRHRLLILDDGATTTRDGARFTYDAELGLQIAREAGS